MDKSGRIYIAGHRGLVGSALRRRLEERGYKNLIVKTSEELDLRRQGEVEKFFQEERPDYIFLAAAKVGGILANDTYKAEFIYDNIIIAANIIHSAYKYGAKKLLNLGSSCIYPKLAPQPMREEHLLTGLLEETNEPYAIAKISAIKLVRYYNEQYGTNYLSVMPTNLYGPNDNYNLETSHVLPALIRKIHIARLLEEGDIEEIKRDLRKNPIGFGIDEKLNLKDRGSILENLSQLGIMVHEEQETKRVSVELWGSGEVYREFLYVEDLADACVYLMEEIEADDIKKISRDFFVNVGVGEDIKIRDLALKIKEIVGFKGEIIYDLNKPDGTPKKLLDVTKMKTLGWQPKISLDEGVKMTYNFYNLI